MANLVRKQQKIFAENSQSTQVTAFRTAGGTPLYSKDVDEIQNANFSVGWLEEDNAGNVTPYAEDMNGVFYSFTRNLAYLYQKGIPEWSNSETYYTNAMCMYDGVLYQSLADDNTNRQPDTQTSYWQVYASPISGSIVGADNLGTGAGISTGVVSSKIQLKSLVAGTNVSLVEGDDSITINSTGGGGGSSTVAWGDITGSISSQVDLATALSQKGTLSGNNEWTGTNYFGSAYPRSNGGNLGSSSYVWTNAYINSVYASTIRGSTSLNLISDDTNGYGFNLQTNRTVGGNSVYSFESNTGSVRSSLGYPDKLITYGFVDTTIGYRLNGATTAGVIIGYYDSLANFNLTNVCTVGRNTVSTQGIYPSSVSGMTSQIGSNSYKWDEAYITTVNSTTLSATTLNLGGTSYTSIPAAAGTGVLTLQLAGTAISDGTFSANASSNKTININALPLSGGTMAGAINVNADTYNLGSTSHYWNGIFVKTVRGGSSNNQITLPVTNGSNVVYDCGNGSSYGIHQFKVGGGVKFQVSGASVMASVTLAPSGNGTLNMGSTSAYWNYAYINNIGMQNATISRMSDIGGLQILWNSGTSNVAAYFTGATVRPNANGTLSLGTSNYRWQNVFGVNAYSQGSDRRLKDNIVDLEDGLDAIKDLTIKSFTYKDSPENIAYGIIAQDEFEKHPELISVPHSDDDYYGVFTGNVLFLAVKAIQELSAKVENLEKKLEEN